MTTTTATTTNPAGTNAAAAVPRSKFNPTWHHRPRSEWTWRERLLDDMGILQDPSGSLRPPVHAMTDAVPVCSVKNQHRWVLPRAIAPLLAHFSFTRYTGINIPASVAGPVYLAYFMLYGADLFHCFRRMVKKHGTFDGAHARDGIPDEKTGRVSNELMAVVVVRTIFAFTVIYPQDQSQLLGPKNLLAMPFSLMAYACIIDFWFYWYHRAMHEVDWLWKLHRTHHTTKHPTAAHGAYADGVQEFMDILGIPFLAYLTTAATPFKIDFATWWISTCYTLFIEAGGHTGIRAYFTNPTTWPLRFFGVELALEDHDLHHRKGWKGSANYGKQTRLWDSLFGTTWERIEGHEKNLDWKNDITIG